MDLIERVIKKEIKNLKRIKDTFDDRFDYLRLDKNERIVPFDKGLLDDFRRAIQPNDISGYTELRPLYRKLASYLGVDCEQILFANGSDLAIKSVYEACVNKGDNVVLHMPSFAMYRVYAWMFGAEVKSVPVKEDWSVDFEKMLNAVDDDTKMVVLENPNGFVGTKPDFSQIEYCAKELKKKNVLLLIDEAYYFIENSTCENFSLISKYPNLVISQTFSKCHGLAGARFGYLVGHSELMQYISRVRPMHEITGLTACAVKWILDHPEILEGYRKMVKESKEALIKEFERLKVNCRDTHGNFILVYFPDKGFTKDMAQKLKERKILVRRPFKELYLNGWFRVTVGSLQDADIFIKAVKDILNN